MLPVIFIDVDLFAQYESEEEAEQALFYFLEGVIKANIAYFHARKDVPKLYNAIGQNGRLLRYIRDPEGVEHWKGIRAIIDSNGADCKSLVAWRVGELRCLYREDGTGPAGLARPELKKKYIESKNIVLYHVIVTRGDNSMEDPSSILGMSHPDDGAAYTTAGGTGSLWGSGLRLERNRGKFQWVL